MSESTRLRRDHGPLRIALGAGLIGLALLVGLSEDAGVRLANGFVALSHLFYEVSAVAALRLPSQVALVRVHVPVFLALAGLLLIGASFLSRKTRRLAGICLLAYGVRASLWILGGNLLLVPGDSAHYLEVARSIAVGEGPVKHYVESYFRDYPAIRENRGVLDDWATPLWSYLLGGVIRLAGWVNDRTIDRALVTAKALSFGLNLTCVPLLYVIARRAHGKEVAMAASLAVALLPVHSLYAAFELRESLVAFLCLLGVGCVLESWRSPGKSVWIWSALAGGVFGLAILARNTAVVMAASVWLCGVIKPGRRWFGPSIAFASLLLIAIAPWAAATLQEYGTPFYSYTSYFAYNFSWTIHHYDRGNTLPEQFYTWANLPEILRVKLRSLGIIAVVSTMILGLPLVFGLVSRWIRPAASDSRDSVQYDRLALVSCIGFVLGTLVQIADVTQVEQLGRYYLPLFLILIPTAVAGILGAIRDRVRPSLSLACGATLVALWWSSPTWAYDFVWLTQRSYQLHLPALDEAGRWVHDHPEAVPEDARIMTWFPWELRVYSGRTTILFPRSYYPGHIERAIRQYQVTHLLWGSFEPPPDSDPETWGAYLQRLRASLGLTDEAELFRSDPRFAYPVRLYRLGRAG